MTTPFIFGVAAAFWLGILTSISPCPLTTNIAAVSFAGRHVDSPRKVFLTGAFYTVGRAIAYAALGALVVSGVLSIPGASFFLQKHLHRLLGPLLVITGLILTGVVPFKFGVSFETNSFRGFVQKSGYIGALLLGVVFALAFCPVSAAIFFGSLIPLALKSDSRILIPAVYGIGTGFPVLVFAVLIAFGVGSIGKAFDAIAKFELAARRITGAVFIVAGAYILYVYLRAGF